MWEDGFCGKTVRKDNTVQIHKHAKDKRLYCRLERVNIKTEITAPMKTIDSAVYHHLSTFNI